MRATGSVGERTLPLPLPVPVPVLRSARSTSSSRARTVHRPRGTVQSEASKHVACVDLPAGSQFGDDMMRAGEGGYERVVSFCRRPVGKATPALLLGGSLSPSSRAGVLSSLALQQRRAATHQGPGSVVWFPLSSRGQGQQSVCCSLVAGRCPSDPSLCTARVSSFHHRGVEQLTRNACDSLMER